MSKEMTKKFAKENNYHIVKTCGDCKFSERYVSTGYNGGGEKSIECNYLQKRYNVRLNLSEGRPVSVIFENQRPVRISKEAAIELSALLMKAVSKIEDEEDRDIEVANTDLENWKKGLSHFTKSMSKQTSKTNEYPNENRY